jgi:hypothetical protein
MNCESALELLLDAEPSEFSASERTPLGDHLNGCGRCRRVAAQLMQDTRGLAAAMGAAPVRRPARRVSQATLIPAFAMAAIVFAVMLRTRLDVTSRSSGASEPVAAAPLAAPVVRGTNEVAPPNVRPQTSRPVSAVRREPRAFAPATPVAPVRLAPSEPIAPGAAVSASGVTVTTPTGTRAVVMQTRDPKLVVVWLY